MIRGKVKRKFLLFRSFEREREELKEMRQLLGGEIHLLTETAWHSILSAVRL